MPLNLATINELTGEKPGVHDVQCPECGPSRRSPANQSRRVLRVWRIEPGFATFHCARCGLRGRTRDCQAPLPDPAALARARHEAAERERIAAAERLSKGRWLWGNRAPITGSIAECYLREARAYGGRIPETLGFLPARGKHGPAMIAAFGFAVEPEPGRLCIADHKVRGVHITRIRPDGSGKAGTPQDKIMVGASLGSPIVLAPANDLLGIAIGEGIEDVLTAHEITQLGGWAAGSASRLPALADAIPSYVSAVTVLVDDDVDGRKWASVFAGRAESRGIEVRLFVPNVALRAVA
jgi:hypothetical protein